MVFGDVDFTYSVAIELPNFGEKENITDEENKPKKVVTFPDHLILDQILPRLPVKSLLRFKSVCRDWRSTISTPEFEKSRLPFSGSHHQFVLLRDNGWLSPSIIDNPNYLIIQKSYKYNDKAHLSYLIGCCNGLVGFSTEISRCKFSKFILLNPVTRQQVEILGPDDTSDFKSKLCWFGYVSSVDDYYIVAFYSSGEVFWTFSWKAGIWKRNLCILNRNARRNEWITVGKPALINDSLYWPIDIWDPLRGIGTEIVEINLVTQKYEVKPRMNFSIWHHRCVSLVNLEGCLALHTTFGKFRLDVWMLRQAGDWNSWEIVYSEVL
ncbi:F-box/kelch-repeat protein At3g23880-like [Silene latifolia]|uniref:F-box/kelch-repeat protein At3g23880-like n=1 Tax=Silene latifolia TaxID=37657 RepID=UPI003D76C60C